MPAASYSTVGFRDRDVEQALDAIAAAGFRNTEVFGQAPHLGDPPTGQGVIEFRRRLDQRGVEVSAVHAPFRSDVQLVLASATEDLRRQTVTTLTRYLRFSGEVGAPRMVVHPSGNSQKYEDADDPAMPARLIDRTRRSLEELVPIAADAEVRMLLENLTSRDRISATMADLRPIVDEFPADQVGLVIDTGHAWTLGLDPAEQIRIAGDRLGGTHLQDVPLDEPKDNHWVPTRGGLDWDAIRAALAQVNYSGAWTFEVHRSPDDQTREQLAQQTRQIATQWGLA